MRNLSKEEDGKLNIYVYLREDFKSNLKHFQSIFFLHGKDEEQIELKYPEIKNGYVCYTWNNFLKEMKKIGAILNSQIDFNGQNFTVYFVDELGDGYPEKGYYFTINNVNQKTYALSHNSIVTDIECILDTITKYVNGFLK